MALDMVLEIVGGEHAVVTQGQSVGGLYQHDPIRDRFCTL